MGSSVFWGALCIDRPDLLHLGLSLLAISALTVKQWTGIPVSVGVATTKALAKIANHQAKQQGGVCVLHEKALRWPLGPVFDHRAVDIGNTASVIAPGLRSHLIVSVWCHIKWPLWGPQSVSGPPRCGHSYPQRLHESRLLERRGHLSWHNFNGVATYCGTRQEYSTTLAYNCYTFISLFFIPFSRVWAKPIGCFSVSRGAGDRQGARR